MQSDDFKKLVQRRVRPGPIDVHPTEKALVVSYELEASVLGDLGDPVLEETKECQKIIRLKSLNDSTDIATLAHEIVEKCTLIPRAKLSEVEQLLFYLQNRKEVQHKEIKRPDRSSLSSGRSGEREQEGYDSTEINETASIKDLDNYIELLYEDLPEKIRASALVLQLSRIPDNLAKLAASETLLGALARVLREDGRRSIDLSTNIVYIYFCFSTFTQLHPIIAQFRVGSLCMDLIEYELKRHEQWRDDLASKKSAVEADRDNVALKKDFEKTHRKYLCLARKQDQLLRVSYYLLLNIAEDPKIEVKMVGRGIILLLIKSLEREFPELLLLVVSFLKKLSIFIENKIEMAAHNIVEKVAHLIPCTHVDLQNLVLRLLLNLSFDLELRNRMVKAGLLPKLVQLIMEPHHRSTVLCILYHISMDDRCKSLFTYTDCIPMVMKLILECPEERVPTKLMALCINLAAHKRNAQLICEGHGLKLLIKRAFRYQDALVMKMIRNIAQHEGPTKTLFLEHVGSLAQAVRKGNDEEFVLECLGILSNLTLPDLDHEQLMNEYNLIPWIKDKLIPGVCEDDLVLEAVVLAGTLANNETCASVLTGSGILKILIELLNAKQEDDEVVLQILYVFHNLIKHSTTCDLIIKDTQVPAYLIDLMHDKNVEIRKLCDSTLDIIAEADEEWAKKIQVEKFCWHNSQWLDMVESQKMNDDDLYSDEQVVPYIQEADLLDRSDFYENAYETFRDTLSPDFLDEEVLTNKTSEASGRPLSRYKNRHSSDLEIFHERMNQMVATDRKNLRSLWSPAMFVYNGSPDNGIPPSSKYAFY